MGLLRLFTWMTFVVFSQQVLANASSKQGWTKKDRDIFYYSEQGSQLIDLDFFKSLEVAKGKKLFSEKRNLKRFRFLWDKKRSRNNPEGLPIGLAVNEYENSLHPKWKGKWVGVTCAACHTGELKINGHDLRVDGGWAALDLYGFINEMNSAIQQTIADTPEGERKLKRLILRMNENADVAKTKKGLSLQEMRELLVEKSEKVAFFAKTTKGAEKQWGFGRMDAGAITQNALMSFHSKIPANTVMAKTPAKMPPIWYTNDVELHHNIGLNTSPIQRNSLQALGAFASIDLTSPSVEEGLFDSTVNFSNLVKLEKTVSKLEAPRWDERKFGKINGFYAYFGKRIYKKRCYECHGGYPSQDKRSSPSARDPFAKRKLIRLKRFSTAKTGTDPTHPSLFTRFVDVGQFKDIVPEPLRLPGDKTLSAFLLLVSSGAVLQKEMLRQGISPTHCPEENSCEDGFNKQWLSLVDYRDPDPSLNPIKTPADFHGYRAPILVGSWATAPYLHNGSVPNMYELLSPVSERSKKFYLGGKKYNRKKLGYYKSKTKENSFLVDTSLPGNSNAGHEFRGDGSDPSTIGAGLSRLERKLLIEYLKTNLMY